MKQLLPLFLSLLPCLAWAQYPSNGNQKITLGEQTTADGLIWRGVAADTTKTVKTDTSAWIVLDTANSIMYHYDSSSVGRKWLRLNLLPSDTLSLAYVNTYGTQTVNGAKTFSSTVTGSRFNPTSSSATGNGMYLPDTNILGFSANSTNIVNMNSNALMIGTSSTTVSPNYNKLALNGTTGAEVSFAANNSDVGYLYANSNVFVLSTITNTPFAFQVNQLEVSRFRLDANNNREVLIGYTTEDQGNYRLQVKDSVYVGGNVSASAYTTRSDFNLKDDIFNLKYGLNDILQLQPVEYTYKSNGSKQLGFIAQDIGTILPEVVSFEESMSVNYQAIIPILTKAIQEQQALIKALEQRIINLENK